MRVTKDQNGERYTQIVLPTEQREKVIRIAHYVPSSGHIGYKPTKYKIMKNFFWPGMAKDIKQACQSCERCQKTAKQSPSVAPMQATPTFTEPNHHVALDVVGPLPITKRKNCFILIYIDLSTRYPDAYPLKITTSAATADALTHIFSHRSLPLEVLTDNGTNFVSWFMEHVFKVMGIKHIKTSPYCPQTNGVLERFHHTLMQMVRKCTELQED